MPRSRPAGSALRAGPHDGVARGVALRAIELADLAARVEALERGRSAGYCRLPPTAWDAVFSPHPAGWILMKLKSGDWMGGEYAEGSYAAGYREVSHERQQAL